MPSIDSSVWLGQPANGAEHDIGMPPQGYISGSVSSSCPDPASLQLVQSSDRFCPPVDQRWALPESLHDEGILQDLIHNERILSQIQEQSESETLHVFDRLLVDADRTAIVYDDRCGLSDPLQFRKIGVNFLSIPRSPNFLPNLDFCLSLENSKHSIDIQPLPQSNSQSSDTQDILRSLSEPAHPGSKAVNSELAVSSSALRSSTTNPKSILPRPTESQHSGTDSQSLLHISQGRNASKLSMAKSLKQGRKVIKGVPAQNCFTWSLHSNQKNVMKNRIERQKSNATSNTGCLRCQQHRIKVSISAIVSRNHLADSCSSALVIILVSPVQNSSREQKQ
jgi:hypothetical protein